MRMVVQFAVCALAALGIIVPAAAQHRHGDQQQAFEARRDGRLVPLPDIRRRVEPTMPGAQYLGSEFDPEGGIYTLKFLRNGSVIWVDVDGRSGRIIGRTGN